MPLGRPRHHPAFQLNRRREIGSTGNGAYAHIRRQFKISIGKMEGIEEPLARIAGNAYVMDAAASLITYGIMLGEKPAVLSAIVKYHCTHRGQQSIIDAMDITGGKGIMLGQSNFRPVLTGHRLPSPLKGQIF